MIKDSFILRDIEVSDYPSLIQWRNDPRIRNYMYTQHVITAEEHQSWINKITTDDSYHPLILEYNNEPLGFVNIHQVAQGGIAEWGFYTSPVAPKGTGSKLGEQALDYAFKTLNLHKICGQALDFNFASRKFHKRLGFKEEGILEQHYFDGQKYYDVICFGLLANAYYLITNNEK